MNKKTFVFILLAGFSILGGLLVFGGVGRQGTWDDPVDQWAKITFSHKFHIDEAGAECLDCHTEVENSESAKDFLLPTMDTCGGCHDVEDDENCTKCHINEDEIDTYSEPVRKIHFNHKAHLGRGLECSNCHAGVPASEKPTTANLPLMNDCVACHNGSQSNPACETCHVQIETVFPQSHKQPAWFKEHKRLARVGLVDSDCTVCHTENFCQTCHAEVFEQRTKGAFLRNVPEYRPMPSGRRALVKQNVHDLNFLFTHPLDFRSKKSDCFSCHSQQAFCSDCHSKNQESGFTSPFPLSHSSANFVRIGVGSGGGLHAELAERDIETCASCHDIEGRDPVCLTCHVDRTPGKGNDPKTHPAGFRKDNTDYREPGATCFNCHTDTKTAGVGFCGYCHGAK